MQLVYLFVFPSQLNLFGSQLTRTQKPLLVRWLSAGKVPTIPFLQHEITNSGPEIKNIGAATTANES